MKWHFSNFLGCDKRLSAKYNPQYGGAPVNETKYLFINSK
jgi:hypothetical protein